MGATAILCSLLLSAIPSIDGEDARRIGLSLLQMHATNEALSIDWIGKEEARVSGHAGEWMWSLAYTGKSGRWEVHLSTEGQLLFLSKADRSGFSHMGSITPEQAKKSVAEVTRDLGYSEPYAIRDLNISGRLYKARITPLINGLPLLNLHPMYGATLEAVLPENRIRSYFRGPKTPKPASLKPRVSKERATKLLQAKRDNIDGGVDKVWRREIKVGLGYYKFEREDKARLIWWSRSLNPKGPTRDEHYEPTFVDALTGKVLSADQGWI